MWSDPEPVALGRWDAPGAPVSVAEGLAAEHAPCAVGDAWGPPWGTSWFRVRGHRATRGSPDGSSTCDSTSASTRLRTGFHAEGLVYRPDGTGGEGAAPAEPVGAGGGEAAAGEVVELHVEAASNPLLLGGGGYDFRPSQLGDHRTAGHEPLYRVARAELAVFEPEVWELVQDLEVLGQLAAELPLADARRWELIAAVDRCLDALDVEDVAGTAAAARVELAEVLGRPAVASAHRLSAVGHAHIDTAWLWPVRETVRKVRPDLLQRPAPDAEQPEFVSRSLGPAVRLDADHHRGVRRMSGSAVAGGS